MKNERRPESSPRYAEKPCGILTGVPVDLGAWAVPDLDHDRYPEQPENHYPKKW